MKETYTMSNTSTKVIIPFAQTEEYYIEPVQVERKTAYEILKRGLDILLISVCLFGKCMWY